MSLEGHEPRSQRSSMVSIVSPDKTRGVVGVLALTAGILWGTGDFVGEFPVTVGFA
jgi:hypothetical protein